MNIQTDSNKTCKHCGWPSKGIYCFECSAMFILKHIGYEQDWGQYNYTINIIDSTNSSGMIVDGTAHINRARSVMTQWQ